MSETLRLAAVFGDHMVLCRRKNVRIFGEGAQGAAVTLTLAGQTVRAHVRDGRFDAVFAPMEAGGPHTLTVTDGVTALAFADVMIGDVYLAGGQSNMEMSLDQTENGQELARTLDRPMIRYVNFPRNAWLDDQALDAERQMRWKPVAPGACGDISGVACHFALQLEMEIGVPIGIIGCFWGGTSAVCWMDEETLMQTTAGARLFSEYAQRNADKTDAQYDAEMKAYDDAFQAWWKRVLALQAVNPEIPWMEINEKAGLCPWPQPEGRKSGFRPAGLAQTMLKRIAPFTLTGFLYYQGEEDTKHPHYYRVLLTALISFWRDLFMDPSLPFLFAQLPMYIAKGEADPKNWPPLRIAQEQVYRGVRNTGLAVLIDCGELDNIHPRDKKTVGYRLFLQAMGVVYGRAVDGESPRAVAVRPEGGALVLTLSASVRFRGEPALFELAGEDGVFCPAQAQADGLLLRLTADGVARPVSARYAWVNYGAVSAFGENGLPLAPFLL